MQQAGRLRLRPWLEEQIQSGRYPGVSWLDQSARIFQIPWKHAARHGWSIDQDATLFRSWAMHTGRYRPGKDKPDPKTWKANFRCALNSLPDICELHEHSRKRGNNAYRVYRMMPSKLSQRRRKGLRVFRKSQDADDDAFSIWKPSTTRPILDTPQNVETPADNTLGSSQTTGMWEAKPEDQEQTDAIFKLMDHFGNADLWNQTGEQRGWRTHTLWEQWHCTGDDTAYSLYTANYNDPLGQSYIKELSDWSTHQQTLMP